MVSFRKFMLFLIMCGLTGSTSRSILESLKPKEITKKGTKKGTNDAPATGSGATTPSPSPLGAPNVAVADKDADTPEKKAEKKAAIEAMYGAGSMYADNTKPDDFRKPAHNPNAMYGASGTGSNEPTSSDKDSDEKPKPEDVDIMYSHIHAHGDDTLHATSDDDKAANAIAPAEDKKDSASEAAENKALKEAMYGKDSLYSDTSDGNDSSHDTSAKNGVAGADKDADSEEKVDIYSDSIYHPVKVYTDESENKPTTVFAVYEGATCIAGFEPILSSWQDCKLAAVALNITGDSIGHVDYYTQKGSQAFGTDVPQGCFRDAVTNRVYFNPGKGGSGRKKNDQNKWSDRVVCRQTNADYSYTYGNTCLDGYLPITTSADDCSSAAKWLGFYTGMVAHTANNPCKMGDGIICRLNYDPSTHKEL